MNELAILKAVSTYVGMYYRFPYDETCSLALRDSLSRGQLFSKLELLNLARNCIKEPRQALFIGHWHGLLPRLFYTHGLIDTAHGVELDDFWVEFSRQLNHDWFWTSECLDITNYQPKSGQFNLIVNTSCEHMSDDWLKLATPGTMVCAQSTDYAIPEHINTVSSIEQFCDKFSGFVIMAESAKQYDVYSRYSIVAVRE